VKTLTIQVNQGNLAPVAVPGGPYVVDQGSGVTLNGSGSSDPNAACGDSIVSYAWDLDNDGSYDDSSSATGSHTFTVAGTRTVRVRVSDNDGGSVTSSFQVLVNPASGLEAFLQQHGLANLTGDDNKNGFNNLQEYAFVGIPNGGHDPDMTPKADTDTEGSEKHPCVAFRMRKNAPEILYRVEAGSGLSSGAQWTTVWTSADGLNHPNVASVTDHGTYVTVCVKDPTPLADGTQRFIRVGVSTQTL
jgi:PKD repeat protein